MQARRTGAGRGRGYRRLRSLDALTLVKTSGTGTGTGSGSGSRLSGAAGKQNGGDTEAGERLEGLLWSSDSQQMQVALTAEIDATETVLGDV